MTNKYDEPLEQVLKARASLRDMEEKKSQRGCGRNQGKGRRENGDNNDERSHQPAISHERGKGRGRGNYHRPNERMNEKSNVECFYSHKFGHYS